jgi:hypothetical protein
VQICIEYYRRKENQKINERETHPKLFSSPSLISDGNFAQAKKKAISKAKNIWTHGNNIEAVAYKSNK